MPAGATGLSAFLFDQCDYALFLYGLVYVLLAVTCFSLRRDSSLPWRWLFGFALLRTTGAWSRLIIGVIGESRLVDDLGTGAWLLSSVVLLETARRRWRNTFRSVDFWPYLLLCALAPALAFFLNLPTAIGLLFGGCGALWLACLLMRKELGRPSDKTVRGMGAAFLVFGLTSELFAPLALSVWPASVNMTGVMAHVSGGIAAFALAASVWFHGRAVRRRRLHEAGLALRPRTGMLALLTLLLLLVAGWVLTEVADRAATFRLSGRLSRQLELAAVAIDIRAGIDGNHERTDSTLASWRELLDALHRADPAVRRLYLVLPRNRALVTMGSSSLSMWDNRQIQARLQQDPPAALSRALSADRMQIVGPFPPYYEPLFAGYVPLRSPGSSRPWGVLVGELDRQEFRAMITRYRFMVIAVTLSMALALIGLYLMQQRRQETVEQLALSEEQFRRMFEENSAVQFVCDSDSLKLLAVNDSALAFYGYSREAMNGLTYLELSTSAPDEIRRTFDKHRFRNITRHRLADGSYRDVEVFGTEGAYRDRRAHYLIISDITELRRTEQALRRAHEDLEQRVRERTAELSRAFYMVQAEMKERKQAELALLDGQKRLQDIIDFLPDSTFVVNREGEVIDWNRAAEKLTGVKKKEIIGQGCYAYSVPFYGTRRPILIDLVGQSFEELEKEYRNVRKEEDRIYAESFAPNLHDGKGAYLAGMASLLLDSNGQPIGAIETIRDISDRKRVENELLAAMEAAQAANRAKREFLANMSHEIRTPMNGVIGMTSLLLDSALTPEQREYAEIIQSSGNSLLSIIDDILDFSKIEAGRMELEEIPFDLRATVHDVHAMLLLRAREKGLDLFCDIDPEVPSLLRGDPGRLRQILNNLIGNAVKFTERGEVALRVTLEQESGGRARLRFAVRDTGIGIEPKVLATLFKPFVQADTSTSRKYGGSGLGLSICRRLVEMMQGEIGAESRPQEGSTFWFTACFEVRQETVEAELLGELDGCRVLVVAERASDRHELSLMLAAWKCRQHMVTDGEEALERLRMAAEAGDPFRIVLVNADVSGAREEILARRVKAEASLSGTVLVQLVAYGKRGDAIRCAEEGYAAYLSWPVTAAQLKACLRHLVAGAKIRPGMGEIITRHSLADNERRRRRILVAEDNLTNQKVITRMMERMGYVIQLVDNGNAVLQQLSQADFDLVLMDIQMPGIDGFEVTRRIRQGAEGVRDPRVPIVALTAHALKSDREQCLAVGMDDYLAKPVQPRELAAVLDRWLDGRTPPPRPESAPAVSVPAAGSGLTDRAALRDMIAGGSEEILNEILVTFFADAESGIARIEEACEKQDAALLRREAHTLKGAAGIVGAMALRETAYRLERAGADQTLEDAAALLDRLRREYDRVRRSLES